MLLSCVRNVEAWQKQPVPNIDRFSSAVNVRAECTKASRGTAGNLASLRKFAAKVCPRYRVMAHLKMMRQNSVRTVGLVAVLAVPLFLPLSNAKSSLVFRNLGCNVARRLCYCVGILRSVLNYIESNHKSLAAYTEPALNCTLGVWFPGLASESKPV
jgi:hypothetical protein